MEILETGNIVITEHHEVIICAAMFAGVISGILMSMCFWNRIKM